MLYTHVVALATLALCVAEEATKRAARNPGLLHLAHAGHSVGSYLAPSVEGDHGGARGDGGAGPQILIYGGHPQVTTRVVSKDSLEELDEDIRQHYQQQQHGTPAPVRYVPNSSFREHYFNNGRQNLGYPGFKDAPAHQYTPSHDYPVATVAPAYSYPRTYGHFGGAPLLYSPQAHAPLGHGFPGLSFIGQPQHQSQPLQHSTSSLSHYPQSGNTASTAAAHYATPTSHSITPTANPLAHTLSSPLLLPGRLPLQHPLPGGVPLLQGLRYSTPLNHGPVFLPVQAFGQPLHFRNNGPQYSESSRSNYRDEQDEDQEREGYGESQGRRPIEYRSSPQREYDDESAYSNNANYQKSYGKYESDESLPKSASPGYQTHPSEDQGSYEDSSKEVGSAEKGAYKFNFADEPKGRAPPLADGAGKVATSYQSVSFETHHPVPRHYPKTPH